MRQQNLRSVLLERTELVYQTAREALENRLTDEHLKNPWVQDMWKRLLAKKPEWDEPLTEKDILLIKAIGPMSLQHQQDMREQKTRENSEVSKFLILNGRM